MRTLAPGNSSSLSGFRRGGGYTLVEILLVLLIAGIIATSALSTVSFRQPSSKDEAERLAALIEHAAVMATTLGSPVGLEVAANHYEFLRWSGTWNAIESGHLAGRYPLPADILIEAEADPGSGQPAPRVLRFPPTGYPPAFGIRVTGAGHAWLVKGDLAGRVSVESRDFPS